MELDLSGWGSLYYSLMIQRPEISAGPEKGLNKYLLCQGKRNSSGISNSGEVKGFIQLMQIWT